MTSNYNNHNNNVFYKCFLNIPFYSPHQLHFNPANYPWILPHNFDYSTYSHESDDTETWYQFPFAHSVLLPFVKEDVRL